MDTIPVGRNYSPQYYYARKMIQDPKWIHRVHNHGVYKTTLLMYKKYAALPTNEKVFVICIAFNLLHLLIDMV